MLQIIWKHKKTGEIIKKRYTKDILKEDIEKYKDYDLQLKKELSTDELLKQPIFENNNWIFKEVPEVPEDNEELKKQLKEKIIQLQMKIDASLKHDFDIEEYENEIKELKKQLKELKNGRK